jgi:hypothetical protein
MLPGLLARAHTDKGASSSSHGGAHRHVEV